MVGKYFETGKYYHGDKVMANQQLYKVIKRTPARVTMEDWEGKKISRKPIKLKESMLGHAAGVEAICKLNQDWIFADNEATEAEYFEAISGNEESRKAVEVKKPVTLPTFREVTKRKKRFKANRKSFMEYLEDLEAECLEKAEFYSGFKNLSDKDIEANALLVAIQILKNRG